MLPETGRPPYPITWEEQDRLFPKLPHGLLGWFYSRSIPDCGKGNVCRLEWAWVRIHDLRHTFAGRLRAVGVSMEDREVLLGHANHSMADHYASADVGRLLK